MRGIATIDRQPGSDTIAVWVTHRSMSLQAGHTNAQYCGIHRIYRDGLCVTDLDETMIVHHEPNGLRRQHA